MVVKLKLRGKAHYYNNKCMCEEHYAIDLPDDWISVRDWPDNVRDFLKQYNGKKIVLEMSLQLETEEKEDK